MNITTGIKLVICFALCTGSYFLGSYSTEVEYQKILLEQANEYKIQVQEAKTLEQQWKTQAFNIENEYKEKLTNIQQSNDVTINKLRQQLKDYSSRMSKLTNSSNKSNDRTRETKLSEETERLINFSVNCSRRLDETITQLSSLQEWIKISTGSIENSK